MDKYYLVCDKSGDKWLAQCERDLKPVRNNEVWVEPEEADIWDITWYDVDDITSGVPSEIGLLNIPEITWEDEPMEVKNIEVKFIIYDKKDILDQ